MQAFRMRLVVPVPQAQVFRLLAAKQFHHGQRFDVSVTKDQIHADSFFTPAFQLAKEGLARSFALNP